MNEIKLYRRQIRPMIYEHPMSGFNPKIIPFENLNSWYPEDSEKWIREKFDEVLGKNRLLIFDERYVYCGDKYILTNPDQHPIKREEISFELKE